MIRATLEEIIRGDGATYGSVAPYTYKMPFAAIRCTDGARVSVQASRSHYSQPRNDVGPYTHVEAGFPSVPPPASWMDYVEFLGGREDPANAIYPYLPVELVREFVAAHGGERAKLLGEPLRFILSVNHPARQESP